MICDIMPSLPEDGDTVGDGSLEDNNFEQLMVNMLDERDKLMETLRETQEQLSSTKTNLKETELERDTLLRQFDLVLSKCDLERDELIKKLMSFESTDGDDESIISRLKSQKIPLAEEFVAVAKELFQSREKSAEAAEEIEELKAERSNTKLLLEHLESLVSRHERSLRMTVVKRQAQSSAGVSSEVEVLKALKSLFEHHKALDEKVRERLRIAVEKANSLEEDLAASNLEIEHLQHDLKFARERRQNGQIANGPVSESGEDLQEEINELKYQLEQRQRDIDKARKDSKETKEKLLNLEEQLNVTTKRATMSVENHQKVQRELEEALAQKADMEDRMMTLEKRYVRSQNELSSASDDIERLRTEVMGLKNMLEQKEDKINNLQEQCKFYEMKFTQSMKRAEELPKVQQELESREAALNAAEERNFTAEEQLQNLQVQIEELSAELSRVAERERLTENHNMKLQQHIDKLLLENNQRVELHIKEKMQTLDDKTLIAQELEKTKKMTDELKREKGAMATEISKLHGEVDLYKKQAILGGHKISPFSSTSSISATHQVDTVSSPIITTTNTNDIPWQPTNQEPLQNQNPLETVDENLSTVTATMAPGPPAALPPIITPDSLETLTSNDAHKLANVLQQQLDAINEELAMLQVEHRTTERLTEQIERRVGSDSNSLDEISIGSSKESEKNNTEEKKNKKTSATESFKVRNDIPVNMMRRDSDENAFLFSSYDPHDTKPLMLKVGRSQEHLLDAEADTPSSQPSDSTESEGSERSKGYSVPWTLNNSFDYDLNEINSNPNSLTNSMESLTRRGVKNRGLKNSLGKIFSSKGKLKPRDLGLSRNEDIDSNAQRDAETRMKRKLLEDIIASGTPFVNWNAPTILAWLELWVKLPEWYIQACRANVKSGSIMSALSDYEIQHEIGVNNSLHRLKLRMAIREMINVTSPMSPPTTKTSLVFGDMNHFWIASEWLSSLGLPQYRYNFIDNLVDARMLEHITKKEYTKYLKVVDSFHRKSITCGTNCLEALNYDRKFLEKRRRDAENEDKDVLVWSNARVGKWINNIGLEEYSDNLRQSGVHGAVIALDDDFNAEQFAYYLQIPSTNEKARDTLCREYQNLLVLCSEYKSAPTDLGDGDFKRTKSWRKKFKKEKSGKERSSKMASKEPDCSRRQTPGTESDSSIPSVSSGSDVTSPRRPRKSPIAERKPFNFRGGPS